MHINIIMVSALLATTSVTAMAEQEWLEIRVINSEISKQGADEQCDATGINSKIHCDPEGINKLLNNPEALQNISKRYRSIEIIFEESIYRIREAITLRPIPSMHGTIPITFKSDPYHPSRITGATLIKPDSWKRDIPSDTNKPTLYHTDIDLKSLPVLNAYRGLGSPPLGAHPIVLIGGTRIWPARYPANGYTPTFRAPNNQNQALTFRASGVPIFDQIENVFASGFWANDWSFHELPVNPSDQFEIYNIPKDATPPYGLGAKGRIFFHNSKAFIKAAGNWAYQRTPGRLFVGGAPDHPPADVELSTQPNLVFISGRNNIQIKDLILDGATDAMVTIRESNDISLSNLTLRYGGTLAVSIKGGSNCVIERTKIYDFDEGGVSLTGGDRITLKSSDHNVQSTTFNNTNALIKAYRPAVLIDGTGITVQNNVFENLPHSAIIFQGNNHTIKQNQIRQVVLDTSDSGAIYTGRDYTAQGTLISENTLSRIQPAQAGFEVKGIYLDDQASGVTIERNIFSEVSQAVFIGGGRSITVSHNIFRTSSPSISIDSRGLDWQKPLTSAAGKELIAKLSAVPYKSLIWVKTFPELASIETDELGRPKYIRLIENTFVNSVPYKIAPSASVTIN